MTDSFRDRLKRLHDAHQRGRDTEGGPSGTYTAKDGKEKKEEKPQTPPEPTGYGWERLGAVRSDEYGAPIWVATERCDATLEHGKWTLGQCSDIQHRRLAQLSKNVPEGTRRTDLLYMDIETTGLGKNAIVFMVGLAFWDQDETLIVEQLVIDEEADEPALLRAVEERVAARNVLITYNGKGFDIPFLQRRCAHFDVAESLGEKDHLDLLPFVRQTFPGLTQYRLTNLEREILGFERVDDIPGKNIPPRWWKFQKNRDAELMRGVLEHNRHDVISMEALVVTAIAGDTPEKRDDFAASNRGFRRLGFKNLIPWEEREDEVEPDPSEAEPKGEDNSDSGGVAEKLERSYRLRGVFARHGRKKEKTSSVDAPASETRAPAQAPAVDSAASGRLEELRPICETLVTQNLWREAFPMLCEFVALSPDDEWGLTMLAKCYRQEGREELAKALENRQEH